MVATFEDIRQSTSPKETIIAMPGFKEIRAGSGRGKLGPIGLGETFKRADIIDWLDKVPYSPWRGGREYILTQAIKRLHEDDYTKYAHAKWEMTPMGGYTMMRPRITKEDDIAVLEYHLGRMKEEGERGFTWGALVGKGLAELPAWMLEIYAAGGITKGHNILSRALIHSALQPHRLQETLNKIQLEEPEVQKGTQFATAWGRLYFENLSELTGEYLVKGAKSVWSRIPFGQKFIRELADEWIKLMPNRTAAQFLEKISTQAGYNGLLAEIGEERINTLLQSITGVEDYGAGKTAGMLQRVEAGLKQDWANLSVEVAVLSVPGTTKFGISQYINYLERQLGKPAAEAFEKPPSKPVEPRKLKPGEEPITKPELETLRDLGYTIPQIAGMSPTEARKAMSAKVKLDIFTPEPIVKELEGKKPEITEEARNAATALEHYWREYDEREFEINVQTIKNQEDIATALNKKTYLPAVDEQTKDTSLAMMLYIDLQEHPEGHKFAREFKDKKKEIYELSQNLPAQVKRIADRISEQNRKAGELAAELGIIKEARENYIAHLWEHKAKYDKFFARFRQVTARAKQRTLEGGIAEGMSLGMALRVEDVTLASQIAQSQVNQAYVGRKLLQMGKEWGILSHQQETDDWVNVEHPGFTTWRYRGGVGLGEPGVIEKGDWVRAEDRDNLGKVTEIRGDKATVHFVNRQTGAEQDVNLPINKLKKVRPRGRAFFITETGAVMEKVPVYAEPTLGKKLNKIFAPSAIWKVPGAETLTRYNAVIKSTILYTSLFHHQAFLRSYAFGSRGLDPTDAYEKGRQAIMNMEPEIRLLVRNGLTLGRIQDYDPRMLEGESTIWGKVFALTEPTEKVNDWLQDLRRRQERFLFNKLGPYLKAQAGLLELRAGLERNRAAIESGEMTAEDVAKSVAVLMNNDFGGLHLGRMGRSNTIQHLMRLMLLAPDWTESNVRSMIDAFRNDETGYMHRMFWGRIAIKGLGATILFNLLLSSFDDEDFVARYKRAWKEGNLRWLDIDITPIYKAMGGKSDARKYFSLIGHFRDPVKFVVHPGRSLKHKGSVVSRMMYDFTSGQDWAGRQYTTVGELLGLSEEGKLSGQLVRWGQGKAQFLEPEQLPSWFIYEGRQMMPIPIQNIAAFIAGEAEAFDAITKSMGLMTTTTYPKKQRGKGRRAAVRR